jgi:hypothetical protein
LNIHAPENRPIDIAGIISELYLPPKASMHSQVTSDGLYDESGVIEAEFDGRDAGLDHGGLGTK